MNRRHRHPIPTAERGATLSFVLVILAALMGLAGLAYDGASLFAANREALNTASAAARAGAGDVSETSIRDGRPELASSAEATAVAFLTRSGVRGEAARLNVDRMEVTVRTDVEMLFLGLFGVGTQTVEATATARVVGAEQ